MEMGHHTGGREEHESGQQGIVGQLKGLGETREVGAAHGG